MIKYVGYLSISTMIPKTHQIYVQFRLCRSSSITWKNTHCWLVVSNMEVSEVICIKFRVLLLPLNIQESYWCVGMQLFLHGHMSECSVWQDVVTPSHTFIHTSIHKCMNTQDTLHTHTHVCIHTYMHTYTYEYIHMHTYNEHTHTLIYIACITSPPRVTHDTYIPYTHTHIYTNTHIHTNTQSVHTIHTYLHTHIHTCMHTRIHTYILHIQVH